MANITSSKTVVGNSIAVNAGDIISRKLVISYSDIVNAGTFADNDTVTFQIPVKAGEVVDNVGVKLVTAFDDSGSGDELNVEVGDGADPNGYITSAQLHVDATEISYVANTGALSIGGSGARGKLYTADDTVDILITPNVSTGTDYSLDELTQGELVVTVQSRDIN